MGCEARFNIVSTYGLLCSSIAKLDGDSLLHNVPQWHQGAPQTFFVASINVLAFFHHSDVWWVDVESFVRCCSLNIFHILG